jgi:hypothetical protein
MSEISPHTKGWATVFEAHARRPRRMSMGPADLYRQSTAGTLRVPHTQSSSRRQSMLTYRDKRLQQVRQRHSLWEQGHRLFGLPEEADVFVKPLHLNRPLREIRSWSEEPSSASSSSQRVFVRAIIRSKSRGLIAVKREFDLDRLRETVLDPLPSSQSSNFNCEVLLSRLELSDKDVKPQAPVDVEMVDDCHDKVVVKKEKTDMPSFLKHPEFVPKATAVPMSKSTPFSSRIKCIIETNTQNPGLQYARSQLPALAAVMLSGRVRRGDTIELATPHPTAWPSTIAYVYTGERELLTENVRENILYLGGKV